MAAGIFVADEMIEEAAEAIVGKVAGSVEAAELEVLSSVAEMGDDSSSLLAYTAAFTTAIIASSTAVVAESVEVRTMYSDMRPSTT